MSETPGCRSCGADLEGRRLANGLCPRCLMIMGLESAGIDVLLAGQALGEYRILEPLGKGGMGEVYLAEDLRLERQVALKILPPDLADDPERLVRFHREIKILASLSHPNIVTVHAVDEVEGLHFFTMERVNGESLAQKLARGPLSLSRFLEISTALAEGLCAAHERGIIHRDLKPENVMITEDGTAKILDFGLAIPERVVATEDTESAATAELTQRGPLVGTFRYMSPEQVRGEDLDPRSDIFSLGVVMYEMASGRWPFTGHEPVEVFSAILRDEPALVTWYCPDLPDQVARIIDRCMEKDPGRRVQTSRDVRNELADLEMEQLTAGASRRSAVEPGVGDASTSTWLRGLMLAVAVAILTLVALYLGGRQETPSPSGVVDAVAVLPLKNLTDGGGSAYFADGMTEALITELAKTPDLKVIAADSVLPLKQSDMSPVEIARRLDVDALVLGSVTRSTEGVRVSAQLMAAETGDLFWADSFERSAGEILGLQADFARAVTQEIQKQVSPEVLLDAPRLLDPRAHEAYLRGRYFWNRRSPDDLRKAIEQLEMAIELEPEFAPSYAALADCYNLLGSALYSVIPPREVMPKAREASLRALDLDDGLAEAYASLGHYKLFYDWNSQEAERQFLKAIELNPNYATAHHWYSMLLSLDGRVEEAIEHGEIARELDPLSIVIGLNLGTRHYHARDFEKAEQYYLAALDLDPDFHLTHMFLARVYEETGRLDDAVKEMHLADWPTGEDPLVKAFKAFSLARVGDVAAARSVLEEMHDMALIRYVPAHAFAIAHAGLGDIDEMFEFLNLAVEERSGMIPFLAVDPVGDPYRSDPRLRALSRLVSGRAEAPSN